MSLHHPDWLLVPSTWRESGWLPPPPRPTQVTRQDTPSRPAEGKQGAVDASDVRQEASEGV